MHLTSIERGGISQEEREDVVQTHEVCKDLGLVEQKVSIWACNRNPKVHG